MATADQDTDMESPSSSSQAQSPQPIYKSLGSDFLQNASSRRNPQEVLAGTLFAPTYRSIFTLTKPGNELLPFLKNLNCSYLSTPGIAPTLTELKQHAQSLTILIKSLTVSTMPGVIDNQTTGIPNVPAFVEGETYDWLNDLTTSYEGPENPGLARHHNLPLTSIMNTLEHRTAETPSTSSGAPQTLVRDICPLYHSSKTPAKGASLPYATHQALISHANEALELLDHEYSAKGGLLSILPPESEKDDRLKAEATLLGQLILYLQHLVSRLHDLERLYANSMDILASESAVPHQTLSRLGPDGRKGREMVYPQDRFVLVNAGDDVWNFLHGELERKERVDERVEANYRRHGAVGEAMWEKRGGREMERGITAVDVTTRYYRLRKDPLKTIFVIPAHQEHPGTKVTREMERQPTVVSVVKPVWPERASMWEMKHRADLEDLKLFKRENAEMRQKVEWMEEEKKLLFYENKIKDGELRLLKGKMQDLENVLRAENVDPVRLAVWEQVSRIDEKRQEANDVMDSAKMEKAASAAEKQRTQEGWGELERERAAFRKEMNERKRKHTDEVKVQLDAALRLDEDNAKAALELEAKLKEVWTKQIKETQVIVEWLKKKKVDVSMDMVSEDIEMLGLGEGERLAALAAEG